MKIDRLILGDFQSNSYVVRQNESASDCVIVDAGLDAQDLVAFLESHQLRPVAVVLTHGHIDHIEGLGLLRQRFPTVKVYIHKLDAHFLTDPDANLSSLAGGDFVTGQADVLLEDGQVIEEAGIRLSVLHTPGHTPGGICLCAQQEGVLFSGDTLFADSVGRTDFPGGSMEQLLAGIRDKLLTLPDQTVVHPGHGGRTTIAREKRCNPFLAPNP
jgi:glyoxylase-like metal-dependent hydrolase (beta-lactamase superfamily II)